MGDMILWWVLFDFALHGVHPPFFVFCSAILYPGAITLAVLAPRTWGPKIQISPQGLAEVSILVQISDRRNVIFPAGFVISGQDSKEWPLS